MKKVLTIVLLLILTIFFSCKKEAVPTAEHAITIDMEEEGAPISKYIYGQFIEHLGRCIYGGIWAEMLEDRKFYYPITDDYQPWGTKTDAYWKAGEFRILEGSPWKVVGSGGTVKMDQSDAFVGEHTPEVLLDDTDEVRGISQEGLALVEGKKYLGRIYLSAKGSVESIQINVSLSESNKIEIASFSDVKSTFERFDFEFTASAASDNASLEILGLGSGSFKIGTLSLMPTDHVEGFNPQVLSALKELDSPVYRWPGGNFVSGYNWKDGIGDMDKRPPRKNPAWTGIEHNDVGIHEYMALCKLIDTEPFIAVNTGLGTIEEVAEQVEYCNGSPDTPMGKWRAENGRGNSFDVKWWAVGNEMYGNWQLGHMPLDDYVKKHNKMAEAMWAIDPDIQLVGVGHIGEWSQAMMSQCNEHMNLISEHIYCQEKEDVVEHVNQMTNSIKRVADAHRVYRKEIDGLTDRNILIAMDEWNYWYGDYIFGELGCRYHLKDALGVAAGFHEYFRNSDLYFMANYAQTVNVIGAIKTTRTEVEFETTGLVLKLYREQFGSIPIKIEGVPDSLDCFAALDPDKDILTLSVVNPTSIPKDFNLNLKSGKVEGSGKKWEIAGDDPMLFNDPGQARAVDIVESEWKKPGYMTIKPYSVSLFHISYSKEESQ